MQETPKKYVPKYKDFTEYLNQKFYEDNPMTLDDDWPDTYNDWIADQDCDTLIKWADEYANMIRGAK